MTSTTATTPSVSQKVAQLREVGNAIQEALSLYISQLEHQHPDSSPSSSSNSSNTLLPSPDLITARRSLVAATGRLSSLVVPVKEQLFLLSAQHVEARVLHVVVAADVAGVIERKGGVDGGEGVDGEYGEMEVEKLARETGLEKGKLARMLRLLCSLNIFQETRPDVFANNEISVELAGDDNFRAWILAFGLTIFSASNELPAYLLHPDGRGKSYSSTITPFAQCMRFKGKLFEWMGQKVRVGDLKAGRNGVGVAAEEWLAASSPPISSSSADGAAAGGNNKVEGSFRNGHPGAYGTFFLAAIDGKDDDEMVERPELGVHKMAMVGAGESGMLAEYEDFPWASLDSANATVVDVGSGIGGFSIRLSKLFSGLKLILLDQPHMIKQAETAVWPKQNPDAISEGRVTFMAHDFFTPIPIKGAEVYYVRNVLLDWADGDVVKILENLRMRMGKRSRVIISEIMTPTAVVSRETDSANIKNYGHYHRYAYIHDIAMMLGHNGRCRTAEQFAGLGQKAGLRLRKVWECRGHGGLVELVLPDSEM